MLTKFSVTKLTPLVYQWESRRTCAIGETPAGRSVETPKITVSTELLPVSCIFSVETVKNLWQTVLVSAKIHVFHHDLEYTTKYTWALKTIARRRLPWTAELGFRKCSPTSCAVSTSNRLSHISQQPKLCFQWDRVEPVAEALFPVGPCGARSRSSVSSGTAWRLTRDAHGGSFEMRITVLDRTS